jgi:hypothetical protein
LVSKEMMMVVSRDSIGTNKKVIGETLRINTIKMCISKEAAIKVEAEVEVMIKAIEEAIIIRIAEAVAITTRRRLSESCKKTLMKL